MKKLSLNETEINIIECALHEHLEAYKDLEKIYLKKNLDYSKDLKRMEEIKALQKKLKGEAS